ncbi:hypothetical protein [Shinella sp. M27]|uniref:hypothetical protein n=1 Tax=Shinella sp. M27 TaxID=3368614 RepID=UPI003BA0F1AB
MDWAGALSAVATAVGVAKDLREIDKGLDQAEMKAKLADVISNLADVRIALVDAREEMRAKDLEIARLKETFAFKATLVDVRGFKFETLPDGTPKGFPFCPRCEVSAGKLHRLSRPKFGSDLACPECKTPYGDAPEYYWEQPGN